MRNLKIGTVTLPYGLLLAPMAGVTDIAFRAICKAYGAEYSVSEMISAKAVCYRDKKTYALAKIPLNQHPIAIQLFGSEPETMAQAVRLLSQNQETLPDAFDVNMGCPVRKIVGNGEGSALMRTPDLAARIVESMKKATDLPITVKCRTGIDENSKNVVSFAKLMESAGADVICVHGRTRAQMYQNPVDIESIAQVKEALRIPVIANGGIFSAKDAMEMIAKTNCDGLAIARGAYGNPFLFSQIQAAMDGKEVVLPILQERLRVAKTHFSLLRTEKGDSVGIREARRQISLYFHGINGAAAIRAELFAAQTAKDFETVFAKIEEMH